MPENTIPNLFEYATKELSQDAMICWLIHWADDRCADIDWQLHRCGRRFVLALLGKHGVATLPEQITTTIHRQDGGIDVLARLSHEHVLLIEDKTETKNRRGQLRRYYQQVIQGDTRLEDDINAENVYPIYLKTGDQSRANDRKIERDTEDLYRPYRVFNRSDFLDVLRSYDGTHQALIDFRVYHERRENSLKSFLCWEENLQFEWSWKSWKGFYQHLEDTLDDGDWSYVSYPGRPGGFLGFAWNHIYEIGNTGQHIFLQLEVVPGSDRRLLCFRVGGAEEAEQQELQMHWHNQICGAGGERVARPRRMSRGWTMTVGHWNGEWLAFRNGRINLPGTVANLREAGRILRNAAG